MTGRTGRKSRPAGRTPVTTEGRISYPTTEELRGAAAAEGADLLEVGPEMREGILALTRTAGSRMRSDPAHPRELSVRRNPSSVGRDDGLPRHVLGPRAKNSSLPLRDLEPGPGGEAPDSAAHHVPQTVLRIGRPLSSAPASPRRPLAELIVRTPPPASH
jgi:hypothetical protein